MDGESPVESNMAAVREVETPSVSKYRRCLLSLSDQLTMAHLEKLKFLSGDYIPERKAEEIRTGLDLFKALEQENVINTTDVNFLIVVFNDVGRRDLVSIVEEYTKSTGQTMDISISNTAKVTQGKGL